MIIWVKVVFRKTIYHVAQSCSYACRPQGLESFCSSGPWTYNLRNLTIHLLAQSLSSLCHWQSTYQLSSCPKRPPSRVRMEANQMFSWCVWCEGESPFWWVIFGQDYFLIGVFDLYMHSNAWTGRQEVTYGLIKELCSVFTWKENTLQ